MDAYYDTAVLVPLYAEEVFSSTINAFVETRKETIPLNQFQRLEFETALRQKQFRGEIDSERLNYILADLSEDLNLGRVVLRPVNWGTALEKARALSERVTAKTGCRTLDLIHVAVAAQWGCSIFVTADERQLAAAKAEGLRTVDVRALHRQHGSGRSASDSVVSERGSRYSTKKRRKT